MTCMQPNLKYRHALVYQLHILGKRITSLVGVIWIVYQACIMNPACQGWLILLFKVRESGLLWNPCRVMTWVDKESIPTIIF